MTTTLSCSTRDVEVPQPPVPLSRYGRVELDTINDRIMDLTGEENLRPTLRQANRLLLAYFMILDIMDDQTQIAYKNCSLGKRMSRHCDAIYCALSYEYNSYDGDMGDMWIPLKTDVRKLLAHIYTGLRAD
jgi:hypothetical protein